MARRRGPAKETMIMQTGTRDMTQAHPLQNQRHSSLAKARPARAPWGPIGPRLPLLLLLLAGLALTALPVQLGQSAPNGVEQAELAGKTAAEPVVSVASGSAPTGVSPSDSSIVAANQSDKPVGVSKQSSDTVATKQETLQVAESIKSAAQSEAPQNQNEPEPIAQQQHADNSELSQPSVSGNDEQSSSSSSSLGAELTSSQQQQQQLQQQADAEQQVIASNTAAENDLGADQFGRKTATSQGAAPVQDDSQRPQQATKGSAKTRSLKRAFGGHMGVFGRKRTGDTAKQTQGYNNEATSNGSSADETQPLSTASSRTARHHHHHYYYTSATRQPYETSSAKLTTPAKLRQSDFPDYREILVQPELQAPAERSQQPQVQDYDQTELRPVLPLEQTPIQTTDLEHQVEQQQIVQVDEQQTETTTIVPTNVTPTEPVPTMQTQQPYAKLTNVSSLGQVTGNGTGGELKLMRIYVIDLDQKLVMGGQNNGQTARPVTEAPEQKVSEQVQQNYETTKVSQSPYPAPTNQPQGSYQNQQQQQTIQYSAPAPNNYHQQPTYQHQQPAQQQSNYQQPQFAIQLPAGLELPAGLGQTYTPLVLMPQNQQSGYQMANNHSQQYGPPVPQFTMPQIKSSGEYQEQTPFNHNDSQLYLASNSSRNSLFVQPEPVAVYQAPAMNHSTSGQFAQEHNRPTSQQLISSDQSWRPLDYPGQMHAPQQQQHQQQHYRAHQLQQSSANSQQQQQQHLQHHVGKQGDHEVVSVQQQQQQVHHHSYQNRSRPTLAWDQAPDHSNGSLAEPEQTRDDYGAHRLTVGYPPPQVQVATNGTYQIVDQLDEAPQIPHAPPSSRYKQIEVLHQELVQEPQAQQYQPRRPTNSGQRGYRAPKRHRPAASQTKQHASARPQAPIEEPEQNQEVLEQQQHHHHLHHQQQHHEQQQQQQQQPEEDLTGAFTQAQAANYVPGMRPPNRIVNSFQARPNQPNYLQAAPMRPLLSWETLSSMASGAARRLPSLSSILAPFQQAGGFKHPGGPYGQLAAGSHFGGHPSGKSAHYASDVSGFHRPYPLRHSSAVSTASEYAAPMRPPHPSSELLSASGSAADSSILEASSISEEEPVAEPLRSSQKGLSSNASEPVLADLADISGSEEQPDQRPVGSSRPRAKVTTSAGSKKRPSTQAQPVADQEIVVGSDEAAQVLSNIEHELAEQQALEQLTAQPKRPSSAGKTRPRRPQRPTAGALTGSKTLDFESGPFGPLEQQLAASSGSELAGQLVRPTGPQMNSVEIGKYRITPQTQFVQSIIEPSRQMLGQYLKQYIGHLGQFAG